METDLPVLTSTRCLIKHCLPDVELLHIMYRVNDLLDDFSIDCTIVDAYKRTGTVILMQYVAAREDPNEMNVFYRRWLFNAATELVAANGDLESLQWLMESYLPDEFLTKAVAAAATNGHLSILQWLFENHHDRGYWGHTEMCGALTHGHTEVVEWLREHAVPRAECLMEVMDTAAVSGCLSIVKWLAEKRLTCDADTWMRLQGDMDEVVINAMFKRQWEVSQWIFEHQNLTRQCWGNWELPAKDGALEFLKFLDSYLIGGPMYSGEPYGTLERAAWSGHLEVVKWLHSKFDLPLTPCAMSTAAQNGHFHVVEWLYENGCEGCDYAIAAAAAAASGRLDMVKWLHDIGLQVTDEVAICNAVEYGHLDVVRWLGQHYKEWCDGMPALLDDAAIKGRLDIVQCLHEEINTDCTRSTMIRAAEAGHLHVVQWLHYNTSASCTRSAMDCASSNGHLDVVKWLHTNRTEGCTKSAMTKAASNGHLDVVQWLHENRREGCLNKAMDNAAKNGHLHVVKWLHANRMEGCTADTMDKAATKGHWHVVLWLLKNRCEGSTSLVMAEALKQERLDVVLFLHSHRSKDFLFPQLKDLRFRSIEFLQWLLYNYADKVDGCDFRVGSYDWRFNHCCAKMNLLHEYRGYWTCRSSSLTLQNL